MQRFAALAILSSMFFCTTAKAQLTADSKEPIDITGDTAEFLDNEIVWVGNVRVVQGEGLLTTDRLIAKLNDDGDFESITALGNVRYSNGKEAITGKRGFYDGGAKTITITEDVFLTQGRQILAAGKVVYWVDSGRVTFAPETGKRIRGIFYTDNDDQS